MEKIPLGYIFNVLSLINNEKKPYEKYRTWLENTSNNNMHKHIRCQEQINVARQVQPSSKNEKKKVKMSLD